MRALLILIFLIALGFIGSRLAFLRTKISLGPRHFFLAGGEYIVLGILLGPAILQLINDHTLRQLNPLLSLILGWVGLLFGLQFQWRRLKKVPLSYFIVAILQAAFTFIFIYIAASLFFIWQFKDLMPAQTIRLTAVVLAAVGSVTAPTCIGFIIKHFHPKGENTKLLEFISNTDALFGLCVLGILFSFFHPSKDLDTKLLAGWQWLIFSIALGILLAALFRYLTIRSTDALEIDIFIIGMLIFSGGISAYLHLSPLFVNFILGVTLANLPFLNKERIYKALHIIEKPLYIILLILAGAVLKILPGLLPYAFVVAVMYVAFRIIAKILSGFLAANLVKLSFPPYKGLGTALASQGGVALAMAINYQQVYINDLSGFVMLIVLISIIANQLISPNLIKSTLTKAGEL